MTKQQGYKDRQYARGRCKVCGAKRARRNRVLCLGCLATDRDRKQASRDHARSPEGRKARRLLEAAR